MLTIYSEGHKKHVHFAFLFFCIYRNFKEKSYLYLAIISLSLAIIVLYMQKNKNKNVPGFFTAFTVRPYFSLFNIIFHLFRLSTRHHQSSMSSLIYKQSITTIKETTISSLIIQAKFFRNSLIGHNRILSPSVNTFSLIKM